MSELVANLKELTLPEDFYEIASQCRESKYYLDSLEIFVTEHVVLTEDYEKSKHEALLNQLKNCKTLFKELENRIFFDKQNKLSSGHVQIEVVVLIEACLEYIQLKEKIDELQLKILKYLYSVDHNLIHKFTEGIDYLTALGAQYSAKLHLLSAFTHSSEEDKYDNYRILLSNNVLIKEFSKKQNYPISLKVRNYDFLLNKWRNQFKSIKQCTAELIVDSSRLKEEKEINRIVIEQSKQSKKINRLNIIAFLIAVIGLAYGTINTIYVVMDHIESNDSCELEGKE